MLDNIKTSRRAERIQGFTITELTVSVVVLGILLVGLLGASTYFFSTVTRNSIIAEMTTSSQNLLRSTVEELRYGAGVRQINSVADSNEPSGGWQTSNTDFVIIIAVPAVNQANEYIIDSDTGAPYNNELVYYKDDNFLYRRTLANPGATNNKLRTTCPESIATTSCPADTKLVEDLDSMIFTLYDQDDVLTTDPLLARSVKIDLTLKKDTFGSPLILDNSIRVTLRNKFS